MSSKNLAAFCVFFLSLSKHAPAKTPVLVELFTSQGCSSCPPAEHWINTKGIELFHQGKIIPLSFHVDYWDHLGWKDPFSSPLFTERQREYARTFGDRSIYTPEMVVGGKVGFVGSDAGRALREIGTQGKGPKDHPIKLVIAPGSAQTQVRLDKGPQKGGKTWLAVFENGLSTRVARGENRGRDLEGNFVVRSLEEVKWAPGQEGILLPILCPGDRSRQGAVVFTQEEGSRTIQSVGVLYPLVNDKGVKSSF